MLLIINIIKCILDQLKQTPENIETVVPSRPQNANVKIKRLYGWRNREPLEVSSFQGFLL